MSSATTDNWQRAFLLSDLPVGQARAVKLDGYQIAIFHRDHDVLYACDNRCPHEGYPLVRGRVLGDSVTSGVNRATRPSTDTVSVVGTSAPPKNSLSRNEPLASFVTVTGSMGRLKVANTVTFVPTPTAWSGGLSATEVYAPG